MPKVTVVYGVPGSGKSTIAGAIVAATGAVWVERDQIRTVLFGVDYHKGSFPKDCEKQVTSVAEELITAALADGQDVVVSDTNVSARSLRRLMSLIGDAAEVVFIPVDVSPDECRRRNIARGEAGGRRVPDAVMDQMIENGYGPDGHLKRVVVSSRGDVFLVGHGTPGQKAIENFNKVLESRFPVQSDKIVLVDCDGTLADNRVDADKAFGQGGKRDYPLFFRNIESAPVNVPVLDLCKKFRAEGYTLLMLTGRSAAFGDELVKFVDHSGAPLSGLIVKPDDDMRPDKDFKKEVLESFANSGKTVVAAVDDRPQSIAVWEAAGIPVFRVSHHEPQKVSPVGGYDPVTIVPPSGW